MTLFCVAWLAGFVGYTLLSREPLIGVKLKRYGKTEERLPVAWLLVTNRTTNMLRLFGDLNPVPTAFGEYRQELASGRTNWSYRPVSVSGSIRVRTNEEVSVRVFLPTNGVPAAVKLFVVEPTREGELKVARSLRRWFYTQGWGSPIAKVRVPGELLATNRVSGVTKK